MRIEYPQADRELLLQLPVRVMNDTLGSEGLVPSALEFGEYPKVYTLSETPLTRPMIVVLAEVLITARKEMQKHMAQSRLSRELNHSVPAAADNSYNPGGKVLVWRGNVVEDRICEWVGPFNVLGIEARKKIVYVKDVNICNARPFNVVQVNLYIPPEYAALSFFQEIYNFLVYFASLK